MVTDVVRAEWLKIRSIRSSAWTLLLALVAGAGFSFLVAISFRDQFADSSRELGEEPEPIFAAFYGLTLAQLALVVFAVLLVGSEYSTGTIRPTLAAVPRRGVWYAGKVLATTLPIAGISLVTVLASFVISQEALGQYGTSFGASGVSQAIVGAWIYLILISLFALGVAAMLRSSTRTLAVLLPVFFLGSQGLGNAPGVRVVAQFLPDQAGMLIMHTAGPWSDDPAFDRFYGPWGGIGILTLWAAAALVGGWLALRRSDA